jgi:predicted DsbA family dithiol-disulfide isomerase
MASEVLQPETFTGFADELGLDRKKFDECIAKKEFDAELEKDISDGAAVGVHGTPVFFINGRMLSGAQPYEQFQVVIDEEIAWNTKGK